MPVWEQSSWWDMTFFRNAEKKRGRTGKKKKGCERGKKGVDCFRSRVQVGGHKKFKKQKLGGDSKGRPASSKPKLAVT